MAGRGLLGAQPSPQPCCRDAGYNPPTPAHGRTIFCEACVGGQVLPEDVSQVTLEGHSWVALPSHGHVLPVHSLQSLSQNLSPR